MLGIALGLVCGGIEFLLLRRLVNAISAGGASAFLVVPLKMLVLAAVFVPVAFFLRDQLLGCGIATAASLIACAVVYTIVQKKREKTPDRE